VVHALEQVGRGIERDDAPLFEHRDALAKRLGFLQVVRREDDGVAVPVESPDNCPQGLAQLDVDARVGSSSTITGGLCTRACATSTRRFIPPESARMLTSALEARSRCCITSSIQAPLSRTPK